MSPNVATMETTFRENVLVALVDDSLAGFQKYSLGCCERFINMSVVLPGYVREPGHHGGLQGVKFVMLDPVNDLRPSVTP